MTISLPSLLRRALLEGASDRTPVLTVQTLSGAAVRVETVRGAYFAKWLRGAQAGERAEAEARGLDLLRRADSGLIVPQVFALVEEGEEALLLLPWLEAGQVTAVSAARLGEVLARQHLHIGEQYGLEHDNFIGPTSQPNALGDDWPTFFGAQRLRAMAERLRMVRRWPASRARAMERLYTHLPNLLPHDPPPSLLHGDLWGGNWLPLVGGGAALVDPAVSFGDREADLAMTQLFGGFPARFYASYEATWPLEPGAAERIPLYNLYHLLNHLLLFGEGYGPSVDAVLRRYE